MSNRLLLSLAFVLFLLDGVVGTRVVQDLRHVRRLRGHVEAQSIPPASVGSLSGFDVHGGRFTLPTAGFRSAVAFVLHGQRLDDELSAWNRMREQIHSERVVFVGVCDTEHCAREVRSGAVRASFPVLASLCVAAGKALARYDRTGKFLVLDPSMRVTQALAIPRTNDEVVQFKRAVGVPIP